MRVVVVTLFSALLVACPSTGDGDDGGDVRVGDGDAGDGDGDTGDGDGDTGDGDGDRCGVVDTSDVDTTAEDGCAGTWVAHLSGTVVDEDDTLRGDALVQYCVRDPGDILRCLQPIGTDACGLFSGEVSPVARCMSEITNRTFIPLENFTTSYCHVDLDAADDGLLAVADPIRLFSTTVAPTLPAAGDETQLRTVVFDDGVELDVVPEHYFGDSPDSYDSIASVKLDPDTTGLCLPDDHTFLDVWGFSPEANVFQAHRFDIRVPNLYGLEAGVTVGLYVQGGLTCQIGDETVPEGEWVRYGEGVVNEAGSRINGTGLEGGLPCLNWFAIGD